MYQQLTIVGNLGRDPEMRYLPNGTAVTNFPVATTRKWTDSSGAAKEQTTWFRVAVFGRSAEACNSYLKKGSRILVVGELQADENTGGPRVYTRKDGESGATFEVRATSVKFLSAKNGEDAAGEHAAVDAEDSGELDF